MTFLSPIAGLIAAAAGLSGLAVFYILKLRRRPVRVSSTLLWQRAVKDLQVNTPFQKFRSNLLFFVQLLAILLVAAAIGRPALHAGGPTPGYAVIVIDNSASMSALDTPPDASITDRRTRLENAKQEAARLARDLIGSGASRVAVVQFANRARTAAPFTTDLTTILETIESISPTDQPSDLVPMLSLLDTLSLSVVEDDELVEASTVVAYLFTDARDPGGLSVSANVEVRPQLVGHRTSQETAGTNTEPNPPFNLGIAAMTARRDFNDPAVVRVFLRVVASSAPSASPIVELRLDGSIIAAQVVELRADDADDAPTPYTAETVFTIENTAGGLLTARLPGSDSLAADDSASLLLAPSRRARVLVVAPSRTSTDDSADNAGSAAASPQPFDTRSRLARPDPFLLNALDVLDIAQLLVVDLSAYESSARSPVGLEELSQFDLIVFDRVEPSRLPPRSSTLSLGAGLPTLGVRVIEQRENDPDYVPSTPFLTWRRTDPLLRHVSLDTVLIAPPKIIRTGADADSNVAGSTPNPTSTTTPTQAPTARLRTTTLATGPLGPLIIRAERGGVQHVVVGFDPARSTWGPDISFLIFMTNIVEQLAGGAGGSGGAGGTDSVTGESESASDLRAGYVLTTDSVQVIAAPGAQRVRLLTRDGSLVASAVVAGLESAAGVTDAASAQASLGVIGRVGVYQLEGSARQPPILPVNLLNASESAVRPSSPIVLTGRTIAPAQSGGSTPREIRWWFILAASLLLLVEWMLFASRMRGG